MASTPSLPNDNISVVSSPAATRIVRRRITSCADIDRIEQEFSPDELRAGATFYDAFRAAAAEHPDKNAIIALEPPNLLEPVRTVTYRELVEAVEQTSNVFHHAAGGAPSVVAVLLPMLPEGLFSIWGAATAGVAVPLNPFLEVPAVVRIMNDTQCTTLVTTREVIEARCGGDIDVLRRALPTLRTVFYVGADGGSDDLATAMARYAGRGFTFDRDTDPHRDAVLMPTGGTTGTPKLVRMTQFGQLAVTWNVGALMGPDTDGVVAHGMPNFHCGGSVSLGLRCLLYGQTLLTLTAEGFRTKQVVSEFWNIARHFRVTSVMSTPTTAQALLSVPDADSSGHRIEDFHVGGSTVPTELVRAFHERFGVWLRENWGMTEVHGTMTGHPNDDREPRIGSAGRPLPYCRVAAVELDENNAVVRVCGPSERGALLVGGVSIGRGYLDEDLNAGLFVTGMPDGQRWVDSGDVGSVDEDGYVWVSNRAKDLIIRGGHNIDPREIEFALDRHPAVELVAAVGKPDAAKGELPIAYVQLHAGASVDPGELTAFCREHVQERAATPVEVIVLDELPLTPVGKLAKPALRIMATEREVHARVAAAFPDGVRSEVRVDNTGRRLRVIVELIGDASELAAGAAELRRAVSTYEFDSQVDIVAPVAHPR